MNKWLHFSVFSGVICGANANNQRCIPHVFVEQETAAHFVQLVLPPDNHLTYTSHITQNNPFTSSCLFYYDFTEGRIKRME